MPLRHLFLVALAAGGPLHVREVTQGAATPVPVGPGAVWNPPPESLKTFHAACDRLRVALFPADRGGPALPAVERLEDGGLRVIVEYALRDGCHACASLGTARFGFRFDGTGQFLETEIVAVRPRG
jgi:hypothetical protein